MKWLEIIHLRVTGNRNFELIESLLNELISNDNNESNPGIKIYRHQSIESDMAVMLHCRSDSDMTVPSKLGLHLVAELREFGWVNHEVWCEF